MKQIYPEIHPNSRDRLSRRLSFGEAFNSYLYSKKRRPLISRQEELRLQEEFLKNKKA